ncbi:hypothetical protein LN249_09035 [Vibrio alginolyticus]|nr:hypothetical protein LN249_09035 [Vibrio alginolyticus]
MSISRMNDARRKRIFNASAIILCTLGAVLYMFSNSELGYNLMNREVSSASQLLYTLSPLAITLSGVFIFLINYLRDGQIVSTSTESDLVKDELALLRKELYALQYTNESNVELEEKISSVEKQIKNLNFDDLVLDEKEKENIIKKIQQNVADDANRVLLKDIEDRFSQQFVKDHQLKSLRSQFSLIRDRLNREIQSLSRRGNVNLAIGVLTTIVAVGILASTVITAATELKGDALLSYYLPRITLSIFIEVFSFFFLKLYKSGLNEIKYFQNELTNAEFRFIAVERSIALDDTDSIKLVINELSTTERNFKLSKGESTVELEKDKAERDSLNNVLSALTKIIPSKK